jgi:hypothetical protein
MEYAFAGLKIQAGIAKALEDLTNMLFVLLQGVGVDKEVIEVDHQEFVEELVEGVIHVVLERSGSIAKAEGHDSVLE